MICIHLGSTVLVLHVGTCNFSSLLQLSCHSDVHVPARWTLINKLRMSPCFFGCLTPLNACWNSPRYGISPVCRFLFFSLAQFLIVGWYLNTNSPPISISRRYCFCYPVIAREDWASDFIVLRTGQKKKKKLIVPTTYTHITHTHREMPEGKE